jgi:hypothetical protein
MSSLLDVRYCRHRHAPLLLRRQSSGPLLLMSGTACSGALSAYSRDHS